MKTYRVEHDFAEITKCDLGVSTCRSVAQEPFYSGMMSGMTLLP